MSFFVLFFLMVPMYAEFILYKFDGSSLTADEHAKAYQILQESQFPMAPLLHKEYDPEADEEAVVAQRLKAELPSVYGQWVPKTFYQGAVISLWKNVVDMHPIDDSRLKDKGVYLNFDSQLISRHKKNNHDIAFFLKQHQPVVGESRGGYFERMLTTISNFEEKAWISNLRNPLYESIVCDSIHSFNILKNKSLKDSLKNILALECLYKSDYLLYRAGRGIISYEFDPQKQHPLHKKIQDISFGNGFLSSVYFDQGASAAAYFINQIKERAHQNFAHASYGYLLPIKKSLLLDKEGNFYIPPLNGLVSLIAAGELIHPRSKYFCSVDNIMRNRHAYDSCIRPYAVKRLATSEMVKKTAAEQQRFIIKNAIGLNKITQLIIERAQGQL